MVPVLYRVPFPQKIALFVQFLHHDLTDVINLIQPLKINMAVQRTTAVFTFPLHSRRVGPIYVHSCRP